MMFRSFLILVALFLTLPSARAEVLIYAGTTARIDAADGLTARTYKVFLVTDPNTGETATFVYGKFNGVKKLKGGVIQNGDYVGGPLVAGAKETDLYVFVSQSDSMVGNRRNSLFLRGNRKIVQVNSIGGNPVTSSRARVLKGAVRVLATGVGPLYVEDQLTVTFDTTRTVDSNVRNLTFAQAVDEIDGFLFSKGFML